MTNPINQNQSASEQQTHNSYSLEGFLKLLPRKNVPAKELREYANKLLEQGIAVTSINYASYGYFERINQLRRGITRAWEIAQVFDDNFHWPDWLDPPRKGIKAK